MKTVTGHLHHRLFPPRRRHFLRSRRHMMVGQFQGRTTVKQVVLTIRHQHKTGDQCSISPTKKATVVILSSK